MLLFITKKKKALLHIFFSSVSANSSENRTLNHLCKFVMDPLHHSAQTSQNFPKMRSSDMEEVSLEEGFQHTPSSSNALRNMLSTLPAIPKMLPMLLGIFCLKMYARDQSEEAASNQDIEPPMIHDAKTRTLTPGNPHIFLVANPQTPSKRRVVIARPSNKWASSRLFSWIKHSVLGMPRTNLLG